MADPTDDLYEGLPLAVRQTVSRQQYRFMTDGQRATLLDDLTLPDEDSID